MTRTRKKLLSVIGSRPEIIQAAPLSAALAPRLDELLVHTGQHYDTPMSAGQLADTRLPEPAHNLGVGSGPNAEQVALAEQGLAGVIESERPSAVLVRGDTNSTLAGARAAVAAGLPLIHVEAGLRSFRDMPEEFNRVEADRMADLLCAPTENACANLAAERVQGEVHLTGDVLYDVLLATRERLPPADEDGDYVLATIHRDYNTDDPARLAAVLDCLAAAPHRVVFPLHPRTRQSIDAAGLEPGSRIELREPVPYSRMLALERDAVAIATDSGGVQREAYMWGVPCITLREETEWVETVATGWNCLVGADRERFAAAFERPRPDDRPALFGDGHAAPAIAALTADYLDRAAASEPSRV